MDKDIVNILKKYIKRGTSIDDLQSELTKARCIIYKSELPPINRQTILHIDGTPNEDYPLRILQAYRQNCNCKWSGNTEGNEPFIPLLKMMNEQNDKRAELLDKAIEILTKYEEEE